MKQFVKRLACGVLAIVTMGTIVGCSREEPSVTTNSDRAPVGYKAIAAMNASAAEKSDRSVRTMSSAGFHKRHTRHCEYVESHATVHRHESRTHAV